MKIAILVPGGVDRSGTDRVIPAFLSLIERLARRHDVHVFASRQEPEPAEWELVGARIHNIGTAGGTTRRMSARFLAEHAVRKFDVVHAFFGWCGASAAIIGWRYRVPVLFHAAGGEFTALREIGYGMQGSIRDSLAVRVAVRGARRVTVATEYMRRLAAARGVQADIVPLGVALDRWTPATPQRRDASRPMRLLHIGDVRPVKDQSMLIAVAGRLREAGLDFELDVAGLDTEGPLMHRDDALRLGAAFRAHGVLRHEALRALVDRADLLLVTSRHEAGPLVVLEAAVAGVPTIGTAVGHVDDWSPSAAVAVAVGDARAMAHEILSIAANEPRRLALAAEAHRLALTMDADLTAREFERRYEEIAGSGTADA